MNFAMSLFQSFRPAPLTPFVKPVIALVIIGFLLWLVFKYIPMEQPIKIAIQVIVVICLVLWLLQSFGIL